MTDEDDQQKPEPEAAQDASEAGQSEPQSPLADPRVEKLREMEEKGDHLDEVIEDARGAVAAARRASSMRLADSADGEEEEQGPPPSG